MEGSYKAYGNNGNCFDNRIDAYDCEGPYSLALRQNLYNMSDHIPVVMQLKANREFVVGVDDVPTSNEILLLKGNVVKDFLEISGKEAHSINTNDFVLYDNLGQRMKAEMIRYNLGIKVDMRALRSGMYYLHYNGKHNATFKVLKL